MLLIRRFVMKPGFERKLLFGAQIALVIIMISANFGVVKIVQASVQSRQKIRVPSPSFEVASIRQAKLYHGGAIGLFVFPGGRISAELCTFRMLMMYAFGVRSFQILGGPGWINDIRYNINAIPPPSSPARKLNPPSPKAPLNAEEREMLQNLLMNRFKLKFHWESKTGHVYVLEMGKRILKHPKLRPAKDKNDFPWVGSLEGAGIDGDGIRGDNISMSLLAARLSGYLDRPVLDETGLKGSYDFYFRYASNPSEYNVVSCIFTSIHAIGLDLKPAKAPVRTIVIDHVESPTPN